MVNMAAEGALSTYLDMTNPGYAILIDSPWGAGKTHFAKTICSADTKPEAVRYVSLAGVSDETAFRRALLKDSFGASLTKLVEVVVNTVSNKFKPEDLGPLARDFMEERFISNLPETLIFDDIERSSIDPKSLLGLINDFVEHRKKRVVLLVNSEKHGQKKRFLKRKEKLVGRTLRIEANFDAAFPIFVDELDNNTGKRYLEKHKEIIKNVFIQAGHQNLRLLRNSLRDCSLVLDRIERPLFDAKEPMARFVRTYFALAMALAKGEIFPQDLNQRDKWGAGASDDAKDSSHRLKKLYERHEGADIYDHGGAVLSKELGKRLFVEGYVETGALNELLKSTGQFEPGDGEPLWLRFVHWGESKWDELEGLVEKGKNYLFESSPIEAGPYLHIADGVLRMAEYGGLKVYKQELKEKILKRIRDLGGQDGIPAADLGLHFGWKMRGRCFSFGGYRCTESGDIFEIMLAMQAAQRAIYERQMADHAKKLLECFSTNPDQFLHKISYYQVPIFHMMDSGQFAEASIELLKNGKGSVLGQVFEALHNRHTTDEEWKEEQEWFQSLRGELERRAKEYSWLASAQLALFFQMYWKFQQNDETTDNDAD